MVPKAAGISTNNLIHMICSFPVFFPFLLPYLQKLGFTFMDKESLNFFTSIVEQACDDRQTGDKVMTPHIIKSIYWMTSI